MDICNPVGLRHRSPAAIGGKFNSNRPKKRSDVPSYSFINGQHAPARGGCLRDGDGYSGLREIHYP